ncbi:kinase-like domain-containing protein [Aspergillus avenaceus]|uniref:Kinase-like domain-containing protein n=1 Tax=Aspergillus avenaceus TaxID=36643 RepID=A0A5N6TZ99_ASPAV|nr:kinase-like domain-containing protein [Aspergillus avenaceus]
MLLQALKRARPLRYPSPCTRLYSIATPPNTDLFTYTSGRYIFNENIRMRERYVKFNVRALLDETERHVGQSHGRATHIAKLAEGGFNRVFLITMDDGFEVVAKIPYRIGGPKKYATASEAATMEYLYSKGIPVPKLFGYSHTENSPVGVEYILMEKAPGVGLDTKWFTMTKRERHRLASSFVEIERRYFDLPFRSIGSIYFKEDVPSHLQATMCTQTAEETNDSKNFCIGPTADYMFWHGRRVSLDLHRGPWTYPKEYLESIARKEIEWTRHYGKPVELDFPHNGIFPGMKSPDDYLHLLNKYLLFAPHLLPKDPDNPLNRPTLRHPDLNPNNIFISPETGEVSCIIDWQHATVEPRLLVAGYPRAFECPDPKQSLQLQEPSLPLDFETLSGEQKDKAEELYRRRLLFYYYHIFNGHLNKPHFQALRDPILLPRQHLVDRAGRQWSGNLMTLKGALKRMIEYWPHLPDTKGLPCPVHFTEAELDGFAEQEQTWFDLNKVVNHWRDQVGGVNEDGWVSNEKYAEAVQNVAELKESLIAIAEGDEEDIRYLETGWLFRDCEEKS